MDKTTEKLGATEEIFPEIQGDYKFWKEDDVFSSPVTSDETNVNFNKPWRKTIRRYIDFGRGDNEDLQE